MVKETPSAGRLAAMAAFALSCFGILMFLWLAFGGSIPLRPQSYQLRVNFPEAATLAQEADVRIAGVNVGKVKTKELDKGAARTKVVIELKKQYGPIPKDSKAILRQKTLLGETYVELSTGDKASGMLADGGTLQNRQVEPTVELDEIFNAFDRPTRRAFQEWVAELSKSIDGKSAQSLNDAFGNLSPFAVDGAGLLKVLNDQQVAVKRLIKNTGVVFGALNERQGQLRQLVVNANNTFEATASRDRALAETFAVFPTFLDESKVTLARLERFSRNTRPLVNDLKGPADDLGPTVRDLGRLSPDLERLFRNLDPLIRASRTGVPDLTRILRKAQPVLESAHVFLPQLNPILSLFNYHQTTLSGFITNGGADLSGDFGGQRYQTQFGVVDAQSFNKFSKRPDRERGQSYLAPNSLSRAIGLGGFESFDCNPAGGEQKKPNDAIGAPPLLKDGQKRPPCFVAPPQLYNGKRFILPKKGFAPLRNRPPGRSGKAPASPDQR